MFQGDTMLLNKAILGTDALGIQNSAKTCASKCSKVAMLSVLMVTFAGLRNFRATH